jgi:hypothetical protein
MSWSDTTKAKIKGWLARRGASAWIVGIGVLLAAPSIDTGLVADDYFHAVVLSGKHPIEGLPLRPLNLFDFAHGDPKNAQALMDSGLFAWSTDPELRLSFWRPLAAITHVIDYALWPSAPWAMHLHSLAWFALALAMAGAVYRRLLGATWVAGLATFLFAVDHAHGPAVGWLANRNAIIALALSLPAILFHDRWRRDGWRPGAWLAPLSLAAGLLAGESALAIGAYLVAHAIHLDRGSLRARVAALAPYGAVVVLWRIAYGAMGYGASGSGVYFDPAREPIAFVSALPERLPALLVGQLALPASDLASLVVFAPRSVAWLLLGTTLIVLALVVLALTPTWRRDPMARFFATGLLLAAIPICATFPADRLLLFVGLGGMGLVAQLVASAEAVFERRAAVAMLVLHALLAPPLLAVRSRSMATVNAPLDLADRTIPKSADVTGKTVVLVNPPGDLFAAYVITTRIARGEPAPARVRVLSSGGSDVELTRVDDHALRVRPERGFLEHITERMLRSPKHPLTAGTRIDVAGMSATIASTLADGRPAEVIFRFDVPLDDPSLVFMRWTPRGYAPYTPPATTGATAMLPGQEFLAAARDATRAER